MLPKVGVATFTVAACMIPAAFKNLIHRAYQTCFFTITPGHAGTGEAFNDFFITTFLTILEKPVALGINNAACSGFGLSNIAMACTDGQCRLRSFPAKAGNHLLKVGDGAGLSGEIASILLRPQTAARFRRNNNTLTRFLLIALSAGETLSLSSFCSFSSSLFTRECRGRNVAVVEPISMTLIISAIGGAVGATILRHKNSSYSSIMPRIR